MLWYRSLREANALNIISEVNNWLFSTTDIKKRPDIPPPFRIFGYGVCIILSGDLTLYMKFLSIITKNIT